MMYSGAVFFDYDGTLADEANKIFLPTKATCETIQKLKDKGYAVFLSTGRSMCYIPRLPDLFDGYVAANGAYTEFKGQMVSSVNLKEEIICELIDEFEKMNLEYSFEDSDALYVRDVNSEKFISMLKNFNIQTDIMLPLEQKKDVCKGIVLFDSDEELAHLRRQFDGRVVFDRHRYNSADVSMQGINKGVGVKAVIEKLGIPFENTYAFGDGTNDVEMLKNVCHGIAMGECAEEVRKAAEYVTDTVINEGITKAFEHYKLI